MSITAAVRRILTNEYDHPCHTNIAQGLESLLGLFNIRRENLNHFINEKIKNSFLKSFRSVRKSPKLYNFSTCRCIGGDPHIKARKSVRSPEDLILNFRVKVPVLCVASLVCDDDRILTHAFLACVLNFRDDWGSSSNNSSIGSAQHLVGTTLTGKLESFKTAIIRNIAATSSLKVSSCT